MMKTQDLQPLAAGFTELAAQFPAGHRLREIALLVLTAGNTSAERKARVLKYPDLAAKLTQPPVGYARPEQWTGWIPPRLLDPGGQGESLLAARLDPGGGLSFRYNQLGRRALGQQVNDSPRRAALIGIAAEAWQREQEAGAP